MQRLAKKLLIAVVGLGASYSSVTAVEACPRGGGGYSYSYSPRPSYCARPVYVPQRPVYAVPPQPQFQGQPQVPPQAQPQVQPQPQVQAQPQGQPQPQVAAQSPRRANPATTPSASGASAETTALAALGSFAGEAPSEPAAVEPRGSGQTGTFAATLPNGATVQLTLQADGNFNWSATLNGKTSSFQGTYTLQGDQLTLVRSDDNQKLAGKLTPNRENGFTFKLDGTQDAGLSFARR